MPSSEVGNYYPHLAQVEKLKENDLPRSNKVDSTE